MPTLKLIFIKHSSLFLSFIANRKSIDVYFIYLLMDVKIIYLNMVPTFYRYAFIRKSMETIKKRKTVAITRVL